MDANIHGSCVLLPCSSKRSWVLPQRCLGEIVTLVAADDRPPGEINWRGENVPVVDFGQRDAVPWRDQRSGTGLIAVVLGQRDETCRFFGVAVRGANLGICTLAAEEIEDIPDPLPPYTSACFRMNGSTYQVPDLIALQRAIGSGDKLAQG
jgi:chemotaxis signal transduction protein